MKNNIKTKIIPISIIIFIIISIILISTYALSIWSSSENTELTMMIGDVAGVYFDTGPNINVSNIGPVLDYEKDGESTTFSIANFTSDLLYVNLKFKITAISDNLKHESFKYVVMSSRDEKNYTKISEGNFKNTSNGLNITLQANYILTASSSTHFKVIIFIEGNMNNPITMQGGSLSGILSVNADETMETTSPSEQVLDNLGLSVTSGTPNFANTSCSSGCGEATVGIYAAEDDLGTSYYFRGDVTNNYVKFGKNASGSDMYWRIIRINGDGTVRMIYDGTQAHDNGTSSSNRLVATSAFNSSYEDNTYVGYMYGDTGQSTYALTHSNKYNSTIKTYLEGTSANNYTDGWYYKNIVATGYHDYIADAIYCNDRSIASDSSGTGIGIEITATDYGAAGRLLTNKQPTLKCDLDNNTTKRDSFTVGTNLGNGLLKYPVGLITADEISYAGGKYNDLSNNLYYLYIGREYWTASPSGSSFGSAIGLNVSSGADLAVNYVDAVYGVRPVISLKSNVLQYNASTSNGTKQYPFVLK